MGSTGAKRAGVALAGLAFILAGWLYLNRGLTVRIHNADSRTLRSVVVSVTGHSYPLGDLPPGSKISVPVEPRGESSVVVEFKDVAGNSKKVDANVYLEPGYKGRLTLEIDADRIVHRTHTVTVGP